MPADLTLRHPQPEDLEAAGAVVAAEDLAFAGEVVLGEHFIAQAWERPDLDLDRDAWVVEKGDGGIIAVAHVEDEESGVTDSFICVHPHHVTPQLRAMLWDAAEARARERQAGHPRPRVRHASNAADDEENTALADRGLEIVRHFWQMRIRLDGPVSVGDPPRGVRIETLTKAGLRDAHRILQTSFSDHFGHEDEPWDQWVARVTASSTQDLDLWLLARVDDEAVGALVAHDFGDRGWVSELGVLGDFRGRGIGEALLRRSFATLAERGLPRVLLNVDAENTTGATALYERIGMSVVRAWTLWEREL